MSSKLIKRKSNHNRFINLTVLCLTFLFKAYAQLPPHFYDLPVVSGMLKVEGVVFDQNHRMYAWEKTGKVWIIDSNGIMNTNPLLSITSEVGSWVDHGMNGFALDPDFANNGYFYVYYTVDRHHL
ncbi:MAG TPA: PQQ-dependent sugar dehydrogenase, partial [Bacteroidia bacterium]|nr:PQQ-dependent sugar dehydrogenase [Bacteroidia bacterium]